jgi:hypothetical protein
MALKENFKMVDPGKKKVELEKNSIRLLTEGTFIINLC